MPCHQVHHYNNMVNRYQGQNLLSSCCAWVHQSSPILFPFPMSAPSAYSVPFSLICARFLNNKHIYKRFFSLWLNISEKWPFPTFSLLNWKHTHTPLSLWLLAACHHTLLLSGSFMALAFNNHLFTREKITKKNTTPKSTIKKPLKHHKIINFELAQQRLCILAVPSDLVGHTVGFLLPISPYSLHLSSTQIWPQPFLYKQFLCWSQAVKLEGASFPGRT